MALSIEVPQRETCVFCEYLADRRPYTIVRRDDRAAMLVTREQRGTPHALVIPIAHRETVLDLADEELDAVIRMVRAAARAFDAEWARPGIAVWQNNGVPASQHVPHAHFHVVGTLDEGGTHWGELPRLSLDETELIAERLRVGLGLDG
ncbi:HIT family protein [Gryllotalpicola reticulitermitis]|uniref:HIT family protein n=1 Tax=Gryllotalpicola reticulitermitis TaxID=1184153 RepID=A0ABV8Q2Z5_9MICO